jgi:RimJ/RimL family protein N-acetyltransferase
MDISTSLYVGEKICLAPIQPDKDAGIESKWTQDAGYLRMLNTGPAMPLSVYQMKKRYEAIEKDADTKKNMFYFTIRLPGDDRLVGFIQIYGIEWNHACGNVKMGIGAGEDRNHGYGTEALNLILRFAFQELNLYRMSAIVPEYNPAALHLFEKAGFVKEVCRREALKRFGQRWNLYHLGLLREEQEDRLVK